VWSLSQWEAYHPAFESALATVDLPMIKVTAFFLYIRKNAVSLVF